MRVSDLIARPVRDSAGRTLGQVADLRLVQDGPMLRQVQHAFRVAGLIVAARHTGRLFGYERGPAIKGPWLVRALLGRLHRDTCYVPWEQVDRLDGEAVVLRVGRADLMPVGELYREK
ncbi:hypothetical protein MF672_034285 [Actinomadura sp. ATCC 31491]|uniref:PRC-barrel domain containing protein n=1 Tax=Actinomadura luzonensis TaxID=2805427 RepID=A0ABT0G2I4_9ACTN|nr:hypothetical protein [Actinomadura luzonensis]MCK2218825.1 hypothetical protein [Actinomadura luzonensis]